MIPQDDPHEALRIVHLVKAAEGGATVYARRLSDGLCELGNDSSVVSIQDVAGSGSSLSIWEDFELMVHGVGRRLVSRAAKGIFHSSFFARRKLRPDVLSGADVVHLHNFNDILSLHAVSKLLETSRASFWTIHGMWPMTGGCVVEAAMRCDGYTDRCQRCPILPVWSQPLAAVELEAKMAFARDNKVKFIANSQWTAARYLSSSLARVTQCRDVPIIYPIIADAFFNAKSDRASRMNGRFRIVLAARNVTDPHKGVEEFMSMLANRPALAEKIELEVLGDGPMVPMPGLNMMRSPYIQDETILAEKFANADLFVSPSETETFGMTLAEAQAAGTPVVAYNVGAVTEAVHPSLHSFLPHRKQGLAILDSIEGVLAARPVERERLRDWTRHKFGSTEIATRQLKLYQRSVARISDSHC